MSEVLPLKVGFDVGNVILQNDTDTPGVDFLERPQSYIEGAIETIGRIVGEVTVENAYLLSKSGAAMQQRTLDFFEETDFYGQTGIRPEHAIFCRRRDEKAPIAAELGLSHFVDDRLDILRQMTSVRFKMLFQRPDKPPLHSAILTEKDEGIVIARDWNDVWKALKPTP